VSGVVASIQLPNPHCNFIFDMWLDISHICQENCSIS